MADELRRPPCTMFSKPTVLAIAGATVLTAALAFTSVVFGGTLSVAATDQHLAPVQWMLETTMENSVRAHARDIVIPPDIDLEDRGLAERGFGHYDVACTPCHGGPGIEPAPWLLLNPPAGSLIDSAPGWSDAELFWLIEHGIKMTGMPALGPTHEDDDIWAIAAFVRQLPSMTPDEYQALADERAPQTMSDAPPTQAPEAPPSAAGSTKPNLTEVAIEATPVQARPKSRRPKSMPAPTPTVSPDIETTPEPKPKPEPKPEHQHHSHHG
jgi:mono/diheme cytochrome c family protein